VVFLELRRESWGSSRVATGTAGTRSCCTREIRSPIVLEGEPRDSSIRSSRGIGPHLALSRSTVCYSPVVTGILLLLRVK